MIKSNFGKIIELGKLKLALFLVFDKFRTNGQSSLDLLGLFVVHACGCMHVDACVRACVFFSARASAKESVLRKCGRMPAEWPI